MPRRRRWTELTRTLQHVRVPSLIGDREGLITWLNDAAIETFGDLRARSFFSVVAPEDVPLARRQLERKLRGVLATDYEIDVLTRDGRRRRAEISSVRIEGGDRCHAVFAVALMRQRPAARPSPPEADTTSGRGPSAARRRRVNQSDRTYAPPEHGNRTQPRPARIARARGALAPRSGGAGPPARVAR